MKPPRSILRYSALLISVFASSLLLGCAASSSQVKTLNEKSVLLEKEVQELKRHAAAQEEKTNVALNVVTSFRGKMSDLETRMKDLEMTLAQAQSQAQARAAMAPNPPPVAAADPKAQAAPQQEPVKTSPPTQEAKLEIPKPAPPPRAPAPPSSLPTPSDDEVAALYQQGLHFLTNKKYSNALSTFEEITRQTPSHPLADNAQYWIGEIYYSQRDYQTALREFLKVVDLYPEGNKTPDAYLKISFSLLALGRNKEAKNELEKVITLYPEEEVASIAKSKLEKMSREK